MNLLKILAQKLVPPKIEVKRANLVNHRILHVHYRDMRNNVDKGLLITGDYKDLYKKYQSENLPEDIIDLSVTAHSLRHVSKKHKLDYEK